jgi:hypothetical protein
MTACEAAEFEQSLNADEYQRLSAEIRLESAISDKLSARVCCPQATWARIQQDLSHAGLSTRTIPFHKHPAFFAGIGTLAAAVILLVTVFNQPAKMKEFVVPANIPLDITAGTETELNHYFATHQMALALSAPPSGHHNIQLKGMREVNIDGQRLTEIYYTCCGQPVEIVLIPRGSNAEKALASDASRSRIQAIKQVGNFHAALLSTHPSGELLNLFAAL